MCKDRKLTELEKKIVEDNVKLIYLFCNDKGLDISEYYDILAIELCKCAMVWDRKRKFSVLAYKAFRNAIYGQWRYKTSKKRDYRKKISMSSNNSDFEFDFIDSTVDLESDLIVKDLVNIINKNVIWKMYVQGYKRKEISNKLNIPVRTIGVEICKLKMEVEQYYKARD